MLWLFAAIMSSFFAGLTSILAKCGVKNVNSSLLTALRTVIVFLFSWLIVFITNAFSKTLEISTFSLVFLILSGLATGISWLCYFKALAIGDVNKVIPIDKSSTILTVLFAIFLLGETDNLVAKLVSTFILAIGIYLMIDKKDKNNQVKKNYIYYAIFSAIFASLTSILAKVGIDGIDSNLATAIRTSVVLLMTWLIVFLNKGVKEIKNIKKKEYLFILLSGLSTGISWLCYYYAIKNGQVSVVVPIDKMSILVSIIFSYFVFKEKLSKKALLGLFLMIIATLLMVIYHV